MLVEWRGRERFVQRPCEYRNAEYRVGVDSLVPAPVGRRIERKVQFCTRRGPLRTPVFRFRNSSLHVSIDPGQQRFAFLFLW